VSVLEVDVWTVPLRPATKLSAEAHDALCTILACYTDAPLNFAVGEHGKPYLSNVSELKFNLSHSHELALVAIAWGVEIGVDVEWYRPMPECLRIAERFFPPVDAAALAEVPGGQREREFHRFWTRIEAKLKACGLGLYGIGTELAGEWSVVPVDVGPEYAACVAANCPELIVRRRELARPWQT
jgi:4'-phosphopantetheinyl transferase